MDLTKKAPQELFSIIMQSNKEAREEDRLDAETKLHDDLCHDAISEVVRRDYGIISETFQALLDAGTELGCEACLDVYNYALALSRDDYERAKQVETKYGVKRHSFGTHFIKDGITFFKNPPDGQPFVGM